MPETETQVKIQTSTLYEVLSELVKGTWKLLVISGTIIYMVAAWKTGQEEHFKKIDDQMQLFQKQQDREDQKIDWIIQQFDGIDTTHTRGAVK